MSLDYFADPIKQSLDLLPSVQIPEPGLFEQFPRAAGMATMQQFATAGRALTFAAGGLVSLVERFGEGHPLQPTLDTRLSDRIFKFHDDVMQPAVDYWTPKPGEVGAAGQVVGQLLGMIPMIIPTGAPGLVGRAALASTLGVTHLGVSETLVRKGVDADKAWAVGAVQSAGLGLGIWVPILGRNLWQRMLVGGAGFNVFQGAVTRGLSESLLAGTAAKDDFKTFDGMSLTLDVLLGLVFGSIAHLSPTQRAQGTITWLKLREWAGTLSQSEVDALAVLRQAQHLNVDSFHGRPIDTTDIEAHVARMRASIEAITQDRVPNFDGMPAPKGEVTPEQTALTEEHGRALIEVAERVRRLEQIPLAGEKAEAPPGLRGVDSPLRAETGLGGVEAAAAEFDPLSVAADRVLVDQPELKFTVGEDTSGKPILQSARQYLDDVRAAVKAAADDVPLFEAAAVCLFGKV